MAVLKKGDRGEEVKELQTALVQLGYSVGPTGIDGIFGNYTRIAVRQFQAAHNIKVDGIVGEDTWQAIQIALGNEPAPIAPSTPETTVTPAKKYSDVMIGGASGDENHQARGGQAGNQTGKELKIQKWYNGNWHSVIRPKSAVLAEKLAVQCEGACANMNIGYDQGERNTILPAAKAAGWDLAKISTPCECDCSALMSMCCICAGLPEKYFYTGNLRTTKNIVAACEKTGDFIILTAAKYTGEKSYLKRGDILVSNTHTCMVLQNGKNAEVGVPQTPSEPTNEPESSQPAEDQTYYVGQVTGGSVYVRSGPGKDYKALYTTHKGRRFHIIEEKHISEDSNWGRIDADTEQWISLKYIKKV